MWYVLLLTLAACATQPGMKWTKPGSTGQMFSMDRGQCESHALSVTSASPERVALVFATCMEGKGWRLVER